MPELPEVETVMNGLKPQLEGKTIQTVTLRHHQLRWPIPQSLKQDLPQQTINRLSRRGKYLLIHMASGTLIIHLGMSGQLQINTAHAPVKPHSHVDIIFSDQQILRYTDPRRFGAVLWTKEPPHQHPLLQSLGPEPFDPQFTADYLLLRAKNRHIAIKPFIMDGKIVVGVGNIYAAEALFFAGIHPATPAGSIPIKQYEKLVETIKQILQAAIQQGGTTIKDFANSEGNPGYFTQKLAVYGRSNLPCHQCQTILQTFKLGQRSTVFCSYCQPLGSLSR